MGDGAATAAGISAVYNPSTRTGNLMENPGIWSPRGPFLARVQRVRLDKGTHIVECVAQVGGPGRPFLATVTSPYITPLGKGIVAGIRKNTLCLIIRTGSKSGADYYVIGFFSPNNGQWNRKDVQSGDIYLISENEGYMAALANGDIEIFANDSTGTAWSAEDGSRLGRARTAVDDLYAGRETWEHSRKAEGEQRAGDTKHTMKVRRSVDEANSKTEPTYQEEQGRVKRNVADNVTGISSEKEVITVREVVNAAGEVIVTEIFEANGTVTIEHPSGHRFQLSKDGDIYITPKSGTKVHLDDAAGIANSVARVGDANSKHVHTMSGPWAMEPASSVILEGSSTVKAGG